MGIETALIAGLAISAISTGVSVYSGIQQSKSAESLARFNQQVAQVNKDNALKESQAAAGQQRRSNARRLSSIRAAQGQRGVVDEGSALESLLDQATQFELDALDIERQGKIASNAFEARANINSIQANAIRRARPLGAASTALSGGGRTLAIATNL